MPAPQEHTCPVVDSAARTAHQEAADLRERAPAVLVEFPGGLRAWSVTRRSVMMRMLVDPRISRDFRQHWSRRDDVPEDWVMAPIAFQRNLVNAYGDEHRQARRRIAPAFLPRRVEAMRPLVVATTERLVETMATTPVGQHVDVRAQLALPLAMSVIFDLFGVPGQVRPDLGTSIEALIDTSGEEASGLAVTSAVHAQLRRLLVHKRAHPGSDLASDLLAQADGEQPMNEQELIDTFFVMFGAGFETTVSLITSAVYALLDQPEFLTLVRRGEIGWSDVVEETLRHQGPVMYLPMRYAVEDYPVGDGVVIPKGDPIIIAFAAAGRDPAVHPDRPDAFDPTRADKRHLAFGHGPHNCVGASLARLEATITLETLFDRLPGLALADPDHEPEPLPSVLANGPARLEVIPNPTP